jgi:hypothetical protein
MLFPIIEQQSTSKRNPGVKEKHLLPSKQKSKTWGTEPKDGARKKVHSKS